MHRSYRSIPLVLGSLLLAASASTGAKADVYHSTTDLGLVTQRLTFDEHVLPNDTLLTGQYNDLGVNFTGATTYNPYDPTPPSGNSYPPNVVGNVFSNFIPNNPTGLVTIKFNAAVDSAALALISQDGTTTITSFLGGVQVETSDFHTNLSGTGVSGDGNFYGFTNSLFDSLTITVASSDHAFIADRLQFHTAAVPELASSASFGMFVVSGMGLLLRRKKSTK